ncbi:MAG TPA: hypothetical protein VLK33_05250 [Terriglobales bacterium]|nr:hypothetical protein [Terriglobales bacterium]
MLQNDVSKALERIETITRGQIESLRKGDNQTLMRLDKELELTMGEKERAMGAFLQHQRTH